MELGTVDAAATPGPGRPVRPGPRPGVGLLVVAAGRWAALGGGPLGSPRLGRCLRRQVVEAPGRRPRLPTVLPTHAAAPESPRLTAVARPVDDEAPPVLAVLVVTGPERLPSRVATDHVRATVPGPPVAPAAVLQPRDPLPVWGLGVVVSSIYV